MKLLSSIKPLTVAITSAILFASLASYAEGPQDGTGTGDGTDAGGGGVEPVANPYTAADAKRIKEGYPLGSMAQWLASPDDYALNPVNIRAGKHPDRSDPNGGPYDVIYIFPDEASAEAWWPLNSDSESPMPTDIPDDAVAFIHWMLDNESGAFPGIMSYSDIDGFKSRNCVMASGDRIPMPGVKDGIVKDCSNPQGSSKRFKMNVLKPNVPVDLVYNVETAPLTYTNYETPPTHDGVTDVGRIYRVLQKWHNATGTDSENGARQGVRVGGFSLELGYGVGSSFTPIPNATSATAGLEAAKDLGFELRPCMADHFLDVIRNPSSLGKNPCTVNQVQDSTGQDLRQEIWLEEEYSTFSPKMYSFPDDKRTIDIGGGFWDKQPAGIEPPEIQLLGVLDSGDALSTDSAYDRLEETGGVASDNVPVFRGATTPNYLSLADNQAAVIIDPVTGLADFINTTPQSAFGYLMYYGVLSDDSYGEFGDFGNVSQGIYMDEDGDPATEGSLIAWWDGSNYRYGIDPDQNGAKDANAFTKVDRETLVKYALYPLQEEPDPDTGEFPPGPLYELGLNDDLAGLNVDSFVYLGEGFDINNHTSFTIRLVATSVDTGNFPGTTGSDIPPWGISEDATTQVLAPPLESFVTDDGVINITAQGFAGDPLLILLADSGATGSGSLPTVEVENLRSGEVENFTLIQDTDLTWKFSFTLSTAANGAPGGNNDGTLNVWPNDFVRVTYVDEFIGDDPNDALPADDPSYFNVIKTAEVQIPIETVEPVVPTDDSDSGCSCSTSPDGRIDPILPAAVLFALGYLGFRRWEDRSK